MFAPPPQFNKIVIYTISHNQLIEFYSNLGMIFNHSVNTNKKNHFVYTNNEFSFEIIEVENKSMASKNLKLQFIIDEIDGYINDIINDGGQIIKNLWTTKSHKHIIIKDPGGNIIELITKNQSNN